MDQRLKKHRYITGFDGIRTIAVITVIFYHLMPYSIQGGYLGVSIFFVLSGYLITDLLNQELEQNGQINIWAFYQRRIRRLYPGLVAMVIATAAYITAFQRNLLISLRTTIITNFCYVYNWFQIHQGQSYFDRFSNQSPFTHLWSLSIEGQFYFVWPFIIVLLWKFLRRRLPIFDVIFMAAFFSALAMAFLFVPGKDPSRLYFGTDTRMFSILLGAALSFVWPSASLKKELPLSARTFLNLAGLSALTVIILMFFQLSGQSDLTYRGGMFFFSLLAMILVATVAHPGSDMNWILSNRVFSWIGKRSYGIYLYQYPVMIFYESKVQNIAAHPWIHAMIEIAVILLISHLSYKYLERPLQHFDFHQTKRVLGEIFSFNLKHRVKKSAFALTTVVFVTALAGSFSSQAAQTKQPANPLQTKITDNEKAIKKHNKRVAVQQSTEKNSSSATVSSSVSSVKATTDSPLSANQLTAASKLQITAVGDSVLADGSLNLQKIFPQMYIDAKVGRQTKDAIGVLQGLAQQRKLAPIVLLSLGTNGPFTSDQLQQIMQVIGHRQVFWVNTHVPTRRWQDQVNQALKQAAGHYRNLRIIDWYDYSQGHTDWFYSDNVHPNQYGLKYYSSYLAEQILKNS
ncbi:acyltransferase family protein [Liquorilactobacillus sicerae]|uniref:acyltransferase family protein n=1 Tax=Liquorilactobacillus sicerae TaxID=1416943 RepID=UPI002480D9AC|nr:acyltransferase family protein [Liquorilactobacillus sicerae]